MSLMPNQSQISYNIRYVGTLLFSAKKDVLLINIIVV